MDERLTTIDGAGPVRRLQTRVLVRVAVETAWDAVTQAGHMEHWWTGGHLGSAEGEHVVLDDGASLNGTIKVWAPPHVFEFTWHDRPEASERPEWVEHRTKSLVRFDLVPCGDEETLISMIQYSPAEAAAGAAAGWHALFERLREYVETGRVETTEDRFEDLKPLYADRVD